MLQSRHAILCPRKPVLLGMAPDSLLLWLCAILLIVTGCSRGPEKMGQVEGVVTLDGKPVSDVEVVFLPDPESGTRGHRSACYTDKDGHYSLRTDKGIEGAVVGTHHVLINDTAFLPLPTLPPGVDPKSIPPRPNRPPVPERYGNVTMTPIKLVDVKSGTQTHNFDLISGR